MYIELNHRIKSSHIETILKMPLYVCMECKMEMALNLNDPIKCIKCGSKILSKKRTVKTVQYMAR